jgi:hypothetical protein
MASVFGTAIIVAKDKVENKFCYMAETEDQYKDPIEFSTTKDLQIGSKLYWEHYYKTREFYITPISK